MTFFDPPERELQPRANVRIEQIEIYPYPDRFRVFIHVVVTPSEERPNLMLSIRDENDKLISELNVIETMHFDMEFTMHLRGITEPAGLYTLSATLYYETMRPAQDEAVEAFEIPEAPTA